MPPAAWENDASRPLSVALEGATLVCRGAEECLAVEETLVAPVIFVALEYVVVGEEALVAPVASVAIVEAVHFGDGEIALVAGVLAAWAYLSVEQSIVPVFVSVRVLSVAPAFRAELQN